MTGSETAPYFLTKRYLRSVGEKPETHNRYIFPNLKRRVAREASIAEH